MQPTSRVGGTESKGTVQQGWKEVRCPILPEPRIEGLGFQQEKHGAGAGFRLRVQGMGEPSTVNTQSNEDKGRVA